MKKATSIERILARACEEYPTLRALVLDHCGRVRSADNYDGITLPFFDFVALFKEAVEHVSGSSISLSDFDEMVSANLDSVSSLHMLCAAFLWTKSKNIYKFDPTLKEEILAGEWTGTINMDIFSHLPEDILFLDLEDTIPGFRYALVKLDIKPSRNNAPVLEIVLQDDSDKDEDLETKFFQLDLAGQTIDDMLDQIFEKVDLDLALENNLLQIDQNLDKELKEQLLKQFARKHVEKVLPFIIYMCSYQPDIVQLTPEKIIKRNPGMAVKHVVGQRVGQVLRKYKKAYETAEPGTGQAKRPHVRRGHFRQQWYGPRNSGQRKQKTIWIAPSYINMDELSEATDISIKTYSD